MKQLYGKLWVKCTAIALLVVFAILFAASALGTAYLFTYGAYADGGEQVRQIAENEILQQTNGDGWTALHAWAASAMTRSPPTSILSSPTKTPARSCSAQAL